MYRFHGFNKYLQVFITSWESGFIYRLNFVMWRFRVILQTLTIYFLWHAVFKDTPNAFDYTTSAFLTYILGVSFVRSVVFSSRSTGIQSDIGSGDLNNHLVRPINYFGYWFSQDLSDKLLNILFSIAELTLLIIILKPPLVFPGSPIYLLLFVIGLALAMIMWFYFSLIIAVSTFWMPEGNGWPQRFFLYVILEFFSGGLFPLDILPPILAAIITRLPTAYLLNFPLQIFLERQDFYQIFIGFVTMIVWIVVFRFISLKLFARGLKIYGAYGR